MPIYLKLVLTALLWGGTFIAGRVLAQVMPVTLAACGRYAIAVVLLLGLAHRLEGGLPRLDRRQLATTFGLGFFGIFLYNVTFLNALSHMPAGRTALFAALNPIMTALMCVLLFRERLGATGWLGIVLALTGALTIASRGDMGAILGDAGSVFGVGELSMMCAATCWAIYTVLGRYALKGLSPLAATTYAAIWGLVLLLGAGALHWRELATLVVTLPALVAMLYLGVFGTVVAFVWYYQGIKAIGPARTAVFNNLIPAFGVLLGTLLLGEQLLTSMLVGGVLVICGVAMTNRAAR